MSRTVNDLNQVLFSRSVAPIDSVFQREGAQKGAQSKGTPSRCAFFSYSALRQAQPHQRQQELPGPYIDDRLFHSGHSQWSRRRIESGPALGRSRCAEDRDLDALSLP